MTYPDQHRQVVAELLAGKFLLESSPLFLIVQQHMDFYRSFFKASYDYELDTQHNYFFLTSKETQEETSRDFILFLTLLAYEMHNEQRDFVQELKEGVFEVADIDRMLKASSKYDSLIKGTQAEDLGSFIKKWAKRNLLTFTDSARENKFRFNDPIHTFLEVALELSESHLQS